MPVFSRVANVVWPAFIFLMHVYTACAQIITCFQRDTVGETGEGVGVMWSWWRWQSGRYCSLYVCCCQFEHENLVGCLWALPMSGPSCGRQSLGGGATSTRVRRVNFPGVAAKAYDSPPANIIYLLSFLGTFTDSKLNVAELSTYTNIVLYSLPGKSISGGNPVCGMGNPPPSHPLYHWVH